MAVWRKWEVRIVDDRDEYHYVDFSTKAHALSFCKAMKRLGARSVVGTRDGLNDAEFFRAVA